MDLVGLNLSPYQQCPRGEPDQCRFGPALDYAPHLKAADGQVACVHVCERCGHGVTRPAMADVAPLYEGRESQDYQQKDSAVAHAVKSFVFERQARALLRDVKTTPHCIVDFACGSGLFTSRLAAAAPKDARVLALDFFEDAPPGMAGVEYSSFRRLPELAGVADLLLCFHALEHDDDCDAFLGRLLPLLKNGGALVVEVPNIDCPWAKIWRANWDNWYLPFHRHHFSRESLRALLRRHGLTIESEKDVCIPSMGRSLGRLFGTGQTLPVFILGVALHPLQWLVERIARQPTALRIIARRP